MIIYISQQCFAFYYTISTYFLVFVFVFFFDNLFYIKDLHTHIYYYNKYYTNELILIYFTDIP